MGSSNFLDYSWCLEANVYEMDAAKFLQQKKVMSMVEFEINHWVGEV